VRKMQVISSWEADETPRTRSALRKKTSILGRIAQFGGSLTDSFPGIFAVARPRTAIQFRRIHSFLRAGPPHKLKPTAAFQHRFAMVALRARSIRFVPSVAEGGEKIHGAQLHYSVDTVRYFRTHVTRARHRHLFHCRRGRVSDIRLERIRALMGLCDLSWRNRPGIGRRRCG